MAKLEPVKLGPFAGMNNVSPAYALPVTEDKRAYVHNLMNVEVSNGNTLQRRKGYSQAAAATALTSAWSNGTVGYAVDNGVLYRLVPNATGVLEKTSIANPDGAVLLRGAAFVQTPTHTVVSDGANIFYVDDLTLRTYSAVPPAILSTSGGTDGEFLVATTVLLNDGSESAPSAVQRVTGSYPLTVTCVPSVRTAYLYASTLDGTELYRVGEITSGTYTVSAGVIPGRVLTTTNMSHLPAGSSMRFGYGRIWSVIGNVVFYSEPMYYNLYNPLHVLAFPKTITAFEVLLDGYLVATTDTIGILRGANPDSMVYTEMRQYGVVQGTSVADPNGGFIVMTKHGAHHISLTGEVTPLQQGTVAVETAQSGASGILIEDGMTRVVTSLLNGQFSGTVVDSFMDAEIVRKETQA